MQKQLIVGLALTAAAAHLCAAEPEEPKKRNWETSAAAGLTLTSGNSETFLATLTLDTKRKWTKDEFGAGLAFGYGESEITDSSGNTTKDKTTDFGSAYAQYNRLFSERFYGGVRLDAGYDDIAGVEYRLRVSPLLGYHAIKNEKTSLRFEVGPSFVWESLEDEDADSYVAMRIGQSFQHRLTQTTRVRQSVEYLPDVSEWTDKYLINAEVGVDAAITSQISLQVVLQDIYNSQPPAGRENNDIRLIAGVKYRF